LKPFASAFCFHQPSALGYDYMRSSYAPIFWALPVAACKLSVLGHRCSLSPEAANLVSVAHVSVSHILFRKQTYQRSEISDVPESLVLALANVQLPVVGVNSPSSCSGLLRPAAWKSPKSPLLPKSPPPKSPGWLWKSP